MKWDNASLEGSPLSQTILEQAQNMAKYLALVEDLETQLCFLHFHETK